MSQWTHVSATIRFDCFRFPGDSPPDLDRDVPHGSEGCLKFHLWENPETRDTAAYTAMIWGDLRDYDDAYEVIAYLTRITEGRIVRQGVAIIDVEDEHQIVLRWKDGKWIKP